MRLFYFLLVLMLSLFGVAQKKENTAYTIRGAIGIPKTVSSRLFSSAFKGVVEGNLSVNAKVFKHFYVGLGYQGSFFENNKIIFVNQVSAKASIPYDTKLLLNSGFLKIGYDYFFSERGYVSTGLNIGYTSANYKNVLSDSSLSNQPFIGPQFSTPFVQPEFSINFLTDEDALVNFSILIAYNNLFYRFDPKAPRLAQFKPMSDFYQQNRNKYIMSWINIGFGFNVLIK